MSITDILKAIEDAIEAKNLGRMYDIGSDLLSRANKNAEWLQAVLVISDYLQKHPGHLWNALSLSKQAALAAPERSAVQQSAIHALLNNIHAMPTPEDRAEAARTVVVIAPSTSIVFIICLDTMLDHVPQIEEPEERRRYSKIAFSYAPPKSDIWMKAETLMRREDEDYAARHASSCNDNRGGTDTLRNFLHKHRSAFEDIEGPLNKKP
jgi:hypothetical protein